MEELETGRGGEREEVDRLGTRIDYIYLQMETESYDPAKVAHVMHQIVVIVRASSHLEKIKAYFKVQRG